MKKNRPRVLVLDGMWNKSLAAVRSLGKRGFFVAAGESTKFATALFSKYCSRRVVYPSPLARAEEFLEWLETELKEHHYDVLFPMELSTQVLLTSERGRFSQYCKIPYADSDLVMKLQDKAYLMKHAQEKGYDIPGTHIVRDLDEVKKLERELEFPVVIKPRMSSGSRGIVYEKEKKHFVASYLRVHRNYPFPIVQEYIQKGGGSYGVCLLLNDASEVRASFVYKRLREYPVSGGPSTLRVSIKRDDIKTTAESLLRELQWSGAAHVEFLVDPADGRAKLLEVNPRFWGSLHLAVEAGVDFPYLLYRMAMEGDIEPVHDYREGVMCRWLIPGDLMHFLSNSRRFNLKPGFFNLSAKDDILSLKDPMPALGRISSIFSFITNKDMRQVMKR